MKADKAIFILMVSTRVAVQSTFTFRQIFYYSPYKTVGFVVWASLDMIGQCLRAAWIVQRTPMIRDKSDSVNG